MEDNIDIQLLEGHGFHGLPAWSQRIWRHFNSHMSNFYQYFHVIFGTAAYDQGLPTDDTVRVALEIFEILKKRRETNIEDRQHKVTTVQLLVGNCSSIDALMQVTDPEGYNILQVAVKNDDRAVLDILIAEGCDLNRGKCTLPLHFACKLGNIELVHYLMDHGAKPNIERGMCFPKPHIPVRHVPSRFHFLETDIYSCDSNYQLPIMFAIQEDFVEVVECLVDFHNSTMFTWPYHRQLLHHACRHGAYKSMLFLSEVMLDNINEVDDEGMTPLLHAVQWGKSFAEFIVQSSANVHAVNPKLQTALHLLFLNIQDPMEVLENTKFLLGTGLEQDINVEDSSGNTALHYLISLVNRLVDSFPKPPNNTSTETTLLQQQKAFDVAVLQTLELLLSFNADPNLLNKSGVTPIHKLLLTFDFLASNDPAGISLDMLPVRERYKLDLSILHTGLETLLKHRTQPNLPTGAGRTPLVMLVHSIMNISTSHIPNFTEDFLKCTMLLCENGAHPSISLPTHVAIVSTLCKFGQKCLSQRDDGIKYTMSNFLKDIMAVLLCHGLNSNHCTLIRKREVEGDSGNLLVELVKLARYIRTAPDLDYIHDWVLTALQWGANPDIEPYPSDPIICTSQSSIFFKPKSTQPVNQYMYQIQDYRQLFEGGYAERLLMLFYNSMDHNAFYQCLTTAKFMSRFDPTSTRTPSISFLRMISNLQARPRSLKEISRIAIYKSIDRQLNLRVPELPLPTAIKEFLINVQ